MTETQPLFEKRFAGTVRFESEDGGKALIGDGLEAVGADDQDTGLFVKLQSWDDDKRHADAKALEGKELEVIVREVPPKHESSRGFTHMEAFKCAYNSEVKVYESSAAGAPHIWLSVTCDPQVLQDQPEGEGTAHLTLEQAKLLRDQLDYLIGNHYQVR